MQRIQPVKDPKGKAAELLGAVKRSLGSTPNLFTTIANSPSSMEGYLGLSKALASGKLNAKTRESLALTIAGYNGCDYCASAHAYLGINLAKLNESEVQANLTGESSDQKTNAALTFALRLLEKRGRITQTDLDNVKMAGYEDDEIIEILSHVALNIMTNYFNVAFGVEVDFPLVSTEDSLKV